MRRLLSLALLTVARSLLAQHATGSERPDTMTLSVGGAHTDGRLLTPHLARLVETITHLGAPTRTASSTLDKHIELWKGAPAFHLRLDADDASRHSETVLDLRTMAVVYANGHDVRPTYNPVFVDAAILASPLRVGRVYRVPTVDASGKVAEWVASTNPILPASRSMY